MAKHRTDLETECIATGVTRICEYDFANAYLITGSERAALIDCGVGIGRLREVVEGLTELPLTVLVTHAHADHDGGTVWFPEVYIHPLEMQRNRLDITFYGRGYILKHHKYKRVSHHIHFYECFRKDYTPRLLPCNEGDTFDLGGRTLTAFLTPGHSAGHLIFRDSQTGIVFSGDNVNPSCMLQFPDATSLEEWIPGALRTLEIAGDGKLWGGHGSTAIPREAVLATVALAQEVCTEPNAAESRTVRRDCGKKLPFINYKSDRIHP